MLELRAVSKRWGSKQVLHGVSLSFPSGTGTYLIAPNGWGKTTLLRIIAGVEHPDSGDVLLNHESLLRVPPAQRDIELAFQNGGLFSHMTVRKNIEFGLQRARMLRGAPPLVTFDELVAAFGLDESILSLKPEHISGGQRKRASLARAFAVQPKVLLIDEPLAGIDTEGRKRIRASIRKLHPRIGCTMIVVTHHSLDATDGYTVVRLQSTDESQRGAL